jgi:hypothetical protein
MHMEQWTKIITTSNPPVPNTPLAPYLPLYQLEEHGCALDGEKTRKVCTGSSVLCHASHAPSQLLKYQFRFPLFNKSAVHDFIDWCRSEGIWPETGLGTEASTSASSS